MFCCRDHHSFSLLSLSLDRFQIRPKCGDSFLDQAQDYIYIELVPRGSYQFFENQGKEEKKMEKRILFALPAVILLALTFLTGYAYAKQVPS